MTEILFGCCEFCGERGDVEDISISTTPCLQCMDYDACNKRQCAREGHGFPQPSSPNGDEVLGCLRCGKTVSIKDTLDDIATL